MSRRLHLLSLASAALAIVALGPPIAPAVARRAAGRTRLALTVTPARAVAGAPTRFRFRLVAVRRGVKRAVAGITVRFAGRRPVTDRRGRASAVVSLRNAGRYRARATAPRLGRASASVLAVAATRRPAPNAPVFGGPAQIPAPASFPLGASNGTEPRVAVAHAGAIYVASAPDPGNAHAVVWRSLDGGRTFARTPGDLPGQTTGTPDVDVVVTRTGRLILVEEDDPVGAALTLVTGYSDDGGATWTQSAGTSLVDQDRPFLAVGPDDPPTHQPTVYLGYHNEFSAVGQQNMVVQVSRDGGASFDSPVPVTSPGQPAYLDLQCGASFGPSSLSVNPATGRIYLVFATLSSALGGCGGALLGSQNEFIIPATRIWVASSPDGSAGSWTQSLAVDDSAAGNIVALQFSPAALDRAGNVYLVYAESPRRYPDYDGAAIRLRRAPPDLSSWSAPLTVAPGGGPGNILPHVAVGDTGNIDVVYYQGIARAGGAPAWYLAVAQLLGVGTNAPRASLIRPSGIPAYTGTASQLMGACSTVPGSGVTNAAECSRSADLFGIALGRDCRLVVSWPAIRNDGAGSTQGTLVSSQVDGPSLCAK